MSSTSLVLCLELVLATLCLASGRSDALVAATAALSLIAVRLLVRRQLTAAGSAQQAANHRHGAPAR